MTSGDHLFDTAVANVKQAETDLLCRKHADYGPKNIADAPGGPLQGLAVRLYDKVARLANLSDAGTDPHYESLVDTALDIANYGTILHMVLIGYWPGTDNYVPPFDAGRPPMSNRDAQIRFQPGDLVQVADGFDHADGAVTRNGALDFVAGVVGHVAANTPDDNGDITVAVEHGPLKYAKPHRLVHAPAPATRTMIPDDPDSIGVVIENVLRAALYQAEKLEKGRHLTAADQADALLRWFDVTPKKAG